MTPNQTPRAPVDRTIIAALHLPDLAVARQHQHGGGGHRLGYRGAVGRRVGRVFPARKRVGKAISAAKRTPLTEADPSLTDLREQAAAQRLADEAKRLADHQKLAAAADTMEEAFLLDPALRAKHAHRVILWRKGLTG